MSRTRKHATSRTRTAQTPPPAPAAVDALTVLHANAAGIDIGLDEMWVAVRADRDPAPLRRFGMNTPDLHAVAAWLHACQVETMAMESTGVYWIPAYELLDALGFQVYLVNARQAKNLPGRKKDETDAQRLRRWHTFSLLNNSFRPAGEMCAVRAYGRHRASLIEHRAQHIQHLQKALWQMHVRLSPTVTDLTGVTGMAIIRAILAGERDPGTLAALRNPCCAQPASEFVRALTGHYRDEHVFALKQALALYDAYTEQLRECDQELERKFSALKPIHDDDALPPVDPTAKRNTHSKNKPAYDGRTLLYRLLGIDLVAVHGLNEVTAQTIITEIGTDRRRWANDKHFCSWLSLAPHNEISGGKVLRRHTLKTLNRAGQAFRLAAQAVAKIDTAYGAFHRRLRAKHGPKKAMVATAHKIARAVSLMLKEHKPFAAVSEQTYNQHQRERELSRLKKKAALLGFTLAPIAA